LDELAVPCDVRPLHVIQEASTLPDHLQQSLATVVILLVRPEVIGEVIDSAGKKGHLNATGTGIGFVRSEFFYGWSFCESHVE